MASSTTRHHKSRLKEARRVCGSYLQELAANLKKKRKVHWQKRSKSSVDVKNPLCCVAHRLSFFLAQSGPPHRMVKKGSGSGMLGREDKNRDCNQRLLWRLFNLRTNLKLVSSHSDKRNRDLNVIIATTVTGSLKTNRTTAACTPARQ